MSKGKAGLSAKKVENLKTAGRYLDSLGLALYVADSGTKYWKYRFDLNRKRREMGLGPYPEFSLEEARSLRDDYRKLVKQGIDPIDHRKETLEQAERSKAERLEALEREGMQSISFEDCASEFLTKKQIEWSNAKHRQQWRNTLRDYVFPKIGSLKVGDVGREQVLECLNPIWTTKTETATRVRQRIEAVLDYARAMDYREGDNPAQWKGSLEPILPKPSKVKKPKHHAALPYEDLPAFMRKLEKVDGLGAKALKLTILCATRTGETLNAKRDEIDLKSKTWTIPAERMKAGKEHRVALSDEAIEIIKSLPKLNDYLFAGMKRGKPMSNLAMVMVLRRMGYGQYTVHGFRSSFRDWVAETTNYPRRVAETALAHQLKDGAEAAYQRGDLIKKRFDMMNAWGSYCCAKKAKVTKIRA